MIKDGIVTFGAEDEERDWTGIVRQIKPGTHKVEYDESQWQVIAQPIHSSTADLVVAVLPWSPSVRLIRALLLYQVLVSLGVLAVALVVVSYFSARIARPLEELKERTGSVGVGSVDELKPSAVSEVAQLQASFLDMSHRVEQAMASQRRFVADASHELKTPLTAISGMLELLQSHQDMEPEDRKQALSVAKKEADRMESLIADLLLLSRAQAKRSGEQKSFKLAELIGEQVETLGVLFPEQTFTLSGDTDVTHTMNPAAFSRVARNLMENAARYAGGEPIEVVFSQDKETVGFSVKDSGPGIASEKQEQLFQRFYRTDSGRARTEGGHGLGLAIVKALVEEGNGQIECLSEVGKGSEFRITFQKA